MKCYFILNPVAGSGEKGKIFLEKYEQLKALNKYDINIYETVGVGDSTRFVGEICTKYSDEDIYIFACGGDGTMNEVVTGVANYKNAVLGIIPTGSCNDFLKTFLFFINHLFNVLYVNFHNKSEIAINKTIIYVFLEINFAFPSFINVIIVFRISS